MLHGFLKDNRDIIIARTRVRVAGRACPKPSDAELRTGIPLFLDELSDALLLARSTDRIDHEQLGRTAAAHGADLLRMGLSIAQVVHDYGDVCQVITGLAAERRAPIPNEDFRTLNLCLDDAIAGAVTEYSRQVEHRAHALGAERLGALAHELRNLVGSAMLSFDMIKSGTVAVGGSTGMVHSRSLLGLRDVIDRSLAEVRLDAGMTHVERFSVAEIVEELEIGGVLQARARGLHFGVTLVDRTVSIEGDRLALVAAVSNLLQNAFKFTRKGSHVSLTVRVTPDRVLFDVEDECGGLPAGKAEELFRPFEQRGDDRSGLGLGLSISLKAARANGGDLHVRDMPGRGCVFTLDLPRKPPPHLSLVGSDGEGVESSGVAGDAAPDAGRRAGSRTREGSARALHVANDGLTVGRLHNLRVLLVEDNDDARDLLGLVLSKHGAIVVTATNGVEAMRLLGTKPDVVVTDISMPVADGFTVLRATRALLGSTPCIAVSAFAAARDRGAAIDRGFDAYFSKPLDHADLVEALAALPALTAAGPHFSVGPPQLSVPPQRRKRRTKGGNT